MHEFSPTDEEQTRALGRALGRGARSEGGGVVALDGPLGAGKTVFVQGIAEGLGLSEVPVSPTFIILAEYEGPVPLLHGDLYRVGREDLPGLGLEESLDAWPGLAVIEWASLHPEVLPGDRLEVRILLDGPGRRVQARAAGPRSTALLQSWRAGL